MIIIKRRYYLVSFLVFLTVVLKGQEVSVTSAFDTTRILIGDQIKFTITVEQPKDIKLTLPFFRDTIRKNIEILSGPKSDTSKVSDNRIRIVEKYIVTSFDSGYYKVNPVYAETESATGLKRYFSDYSILEVVRTRLAPKDTSAKIFDIVPPYKAPVTLGEIMPWLFLALLAAVIIFLIIRLIRRFSGNKKEAPVLINIEPAHVIAFRELEKLRDEKLPESGENKKYHTRLTEIIRQYLENRFQVYSMELTTEETLSALVKTGFKKGDSYNRLKSVLSFADLVKFAKYKPEPIENEESFTRSWDFVNETKRPEEPVIENVELKVEEGGNKS